MSLAIAKSLEIHFIVSPFWEGRAMLFVLNVRRNAVLWR